MEAEGCYTFPERDGKARIIGIERRWMGGRKWSVAGGTRGLKVPELFGGRLGPIAAFHGCESERRSYGPSR